MSYIPIGRSQDTNSQRKTQLRLQRNIQLDPEVPKRQSATPSFEDALAELFALHRDRLRRMVRFRLHPKLVRRIDPDDVLQEGSLRAGQVVLG